MARRARLPRHASGPRRNPYEVGCVLTEETGKENFTRPPGDLFRESGPHATPTLVRSSTTPGPTSTVAVVAAATRSAILTA